MGCGKSSVGRELSQLLCCPFIDLDEAIEEAAGKSIPEIFSSDGEVAFRRLETDVLREILKAVHKRQCAPLIVLALGGGTVMTPECAEMVRKNTRGIYLRASVDTLLERLSSEISTRPLLCTQGGSLPLRSRIEELMLQRTSTYENTAKIIIDTDGKSIGQICSEII